MYRAVFSIYNLLVLICYRVRKQRTMLNKIVSKIRINSLSSEEMHSVLCYEQNVSFFLSIAITF